MKKSLLIIKRHGEKAGVGHIFTCLKESKLKEISYS